MTRQKGCADGGMCRCQDPGTRFQDNNTHMMEAQDRPSFSHHSWLLTPDTWLLNSRKEVIQPQVPLRLPCYDFTPVADLTVVGYLPQANLRVGAPASGKANSHGVTGGVYKARERIHRGMLIRDY
jgi:hypothetical protein